MKPLPFQPAAAALRADRALLVHPLGYLAGAAGQDIARLANIMPPIGLAGLAAWLERQSIRTTVVDANAQPDALARMREVLQDERPACVGFSCTTASYLDGARLAAAAKAVLPGVRTVVGGPHVSALQAAALAGFPALDFAVVGEGEQTFSELLAGGWESPETVPGLVYREADGTPRFSGPRNERLELDALPFPAYGKLSGFPASYCLPLFSYPRTPNTICVTSRGCPYACSYCDRSVFGRSFRYNSAAYMLALVEELETRYGVRHLNFYDDQFTFHRARIEEFALGLARRRRRLTFNCAARAEHLDAGLLRLLKAAGCWMISLGIETGDPALLARHRSYADLDGLRERILLIKRAGIRVKGLLMMGLPGETPESIRRSAAYVFALPLDELNLSKFTPFPGSPAYADIHAHGTFDEDWERMDCMHFQFVPRGMTREQLERLHREFYRRYFLRPRSLWNYTSMIWRSPDSWRRFWRHAGSFLRFARSERRLGEEETS